MDEGGAARAAEQRTAMSSSPGDGRNVILIVLGGGDCDRSS